MRVPVRLAGAAAEPAHLLHGGVEHQPQPDLRQRARPGAVGHDLDGQQAVSRSPGSPAERGLEAEVGAGRRDPQPGAQFVFAATGRVAWVTWAAAVSRRSSGGR